MKISPTARNAYQDHLEDETERRRTIITCSEGGILPSLNTYLNQIDDLGGPDGLTGEERKLYDATLPLVERQQEADEAAYDEQVAEDMRRMSIIRGTPEVGGMFTSRKDYFDAVASLGILSGEESREYSLAQSMVLDFIDDIADAYNNRS